RNRVPFLFSSVIDVMPLRERAAGLVMTLACKNSERPSAEGIRVPRPRAHPRPKGHEQYQLREAGLGGNATISGEPGHGTCSSGFSRVRPLPQIIRCINA